MLFLKWEHYVCIKNCINNWSRRFIIRKFYLIQSKKCIWLCEENPFCFITCSVTEIGSKLPQFINTLFKGFWYTSLNRPVTLIYLSSFCVPFLFKWLTVISAAESVILDVTAFSWGEIPNLLSFSTLLCTSISYSVLFEENAFIANLTSVKCVLFILTGTVIFFCINMRNVN